MCLNQFSNWSERKVQQCSAVVPYDSKTLFTCSFDLHQQYFPLWLQVDAFSLPFPLVNPPPFHLSICLYIGIQDYLLNISELSPLHKFREKKTKTSPFRPTLFLSQQGGGGESNCERTFSLQSTTRLLLVFFEGSTCHTERKCAHTLQWNGSAPISVCSPPSQKYAHAWQRGGVKGGREMWMLGAVIWREGRKTRGGGGAWRTAIRIRRLEVEDDIIWSRWAGANEHCKSPNVNELPHKLLLPGGLLKPDPGLSLNCRGWHNACFNNI